MFGNGLNTVSASTVSNTELGEFFCPHRVPGRELSEFLSAYYLCAKANSPSFPQNSPSLPQTQWGSVSSLLRNSTLETVFRPFPRCIAAISFVVSHFCLPWWQSCLRCCIQSSQRWRQKLSLSLFWGCLYLASQEYCIHKKIWGNSFSAHYIVFM